MKGEDPEIGRAHKGVARRQCSGRSSPGSEPQITFPSRGTNCSQ